MRNDFKIKLNSAKFEPRAFEEKLRQAFLAYANRDYDDVVFKAAEYTLLLGGKRLRPQLMELSWKLFADVPTEDILPFQVALEMIHTYSLIHDDLPAMDNDDLRRGKPACHVVYGEANALLAGDLLQSAAFEILCLELMKNSSTRRVAAVYNIVRESGGHGMILGQSLDLNIANKTTDLSQVSRMEDLKTAGLIRAAIVSGAILGGADSEAQVSLHKYASLLGEAFQIRDDILDVIATSAELGKSAGKDDRDHKNTYISLMGEQKATEVLQNKTREAIEILQQLTQTYAVDISALQELTTSLSVRRM